MKIDLENVATKRIILAITLIVVLAVVDGKIFCRYQASNPRTMVCKSNVPDRRIRLNRMSFPNSDVITTIILVGCAIQEFNREALYGFPNLQNLDVSGNGLETLKVGAFNKSRQLLYLDLSRNKIKRIPIGIFDNNLNLKYIDLQRNMLSQIDASVFNNLINLHNINLLGNLLDEDSFRNALFANNHEIASIRLSVNTLNNFPENTLKGIEKLKYLELENNNLDKIPLCAIKDNMITLNNLQLKRNIISSINDSTTFVNLINLNILDLSENVIGYIHKDVFRPLTKLTYLSLHANNLKIISGDMFKTMMLLSHVDLSNNMLTYIPDNCFLGTQLKILDLRKNRITYMKSNFCTDLLNSGANLEVFYFNYNPWQCACLRDLLHETKRFNIKYASHRYKGEEPVCVTTDNFSCKRTVRDQIYYEKLFAENIQLSP